MRVFLAVVIFVFCAGPSWAVLVSGDELKHRQIVPQETPADTPVPATPAPTPAPKRPGSMHHPLSSSPNAASPFVKKVGEVPPVPKYTQVRGKGKVSLTTTTAGQATVTASGGSQTS